MFRNPAYVIDFINFWSEWRGSNSRPLPPEGDKVVGMRSESLVLLGSGSFEIATDLLKRCGIVAEFYDSMQVQPPPSAQAVGYIAFLFAFGVYCRHRRVSSRGGRAQQ